MLIRKLFFAVFVLGLFLTLNGTAIADRPTDVVEKAMNPPSAKVSRHLPEGYTVPANYKAAASDALDPNYQKTGALPTQNSPDTSSCVFINYQIDANTSWYWTYKAAGASQGLKYAMRFDAAEQTSHVCEVYGLYPYIGRNYNLATPGSGYPDIKVEVFNDAAGLPGTLIYSEVFPIGEVLPVDGNYFGLYFSGGTGTGGAVMTPGPTFHIALSTVGGDPAADTRFYSDDRGPGCIHPSAGIPGTAIPTGRSSYYNGTSWIKGSLAFSCGDPNFDMWVDYCFWYTLCTQRMSMTAGSVGLWAMPDDGTFNCYDVDCNPWTSGGIWNGVAQSFTLMGDTLAMVRVLHYDYSKYIGPYYPVSGGNNVIVEIWNDNGAGEMVGPAIATRTITGTRATLFAQTGGVNAAGWNWVYVDFRADNLTLSGTYHVSVRSATDNAAQGFLFYALTDRAGGASVNFNGGGDTWKKIYHHNSFGTDVAGGAEMALDIRPWTCADEFSQCATPSTFDELVGFNAIYALGTGMDTRYAQRIKGTDVNRVQSISAQLIDETYWGDPAEMNGAPDIEIAIYSFIDPDSGLQPTPVWADTFFAEVGVTYEPGWTTVVIPGGFQINGDFYVGVRNVSADKVNNYFYTPAQKNQPEINDGMVYWRTSRMAWYDFGAIQGFPANALFRVNLCSIPFQEITCVDENNWPTLGKNFARTGHSGLPLSDAYCDLTLNWHHRAAGKNIIYAAPIIYKGHVVCSFGDQYRIFDLTDGTLLATLSGPANGVGSAIRSTPCIAAIDSAGTPIDVLFIAGGSIKNVSAYRFAPPYTNRMWTSAFASGTTALTTYGGLTLVKPGGLDVLVWNTNNGNLYANEALSGVPFAGWGTQPKSLGLEMIVQGTTDGTNLYYATADVSLGVVRGDLYKIKAADGSILKQLSAAGGLQADVLYPEITDSLGTWTEGFFSGAAYDAELNRLYIQSENEDGNAPADGVFYTINAADFTLANAVQSAESRYNFPVIDKKRVYVASAARWVYPPLGGQLLAFRRPQGDMSWISGSPTNAPPGQYLGQIAETCEPGAPDQILAFDASLSSFNWSGFLGVFNADNGSESFRRRIDWNAQAFNVGLGVSLGKDDDGSVHVVAADIVGNLYDLTKKTDRPRLEIQSFHPKLAVQFGFNTNLKVPMDNILYNSGCATLNIAAYYVDTAGAPGSSTPDFTVVGETVRPDVLDMASNIADRLTGRKLLNNIEVPSAFFAENYNPNLYVPEGEKSTRSAALYGGALEFLNSVTVPTSIGKGDSADIDLYVDQTKLKRGPHPFYIRLDTDDPDYFLNNSYLDAPNDTLMPRILVIVSGGCAIDTVTLKFGMGGANMQWATNTGRLGTGDWTPHGFKFDGDAASYYQGSYIYGINKYRIAMNSQDWTSGGGENDGFFSMAPDPNWCDHTCDAYATAVTPNLGEYSTDGLSYVPISGNMACKTFIDSVQSCYNPAETPVVDKWTWADCWSRDGKFDDTLTIGMKVNSRVFGALGIQALANFTLEVMDVTERNGVPVTGWYMGHYADYDVTTGDKPNYDASISAAWSGAHGKAKAFGQVKIPFGPGFTGMKNAVSMYGNEGLWRSDPYYDSAYFWMSTVSGLRAHPNTGDYQMHMTFGGHDFAGHGTFRLAVANFGLTTLTDADSSIYIAPLAHAANKWAGFGRGDVDNDNKVTIADVVYLNENVNGTPKGPGPIPFPWLGDVDCDNDLVPDQADVDYLANYYFNNGPVPCGDWAGWTNATP